jgi:hypothetical protein
VSTGTIVVLAVAAAVTALFVPLRIAVAKQRQAVETVRARLAAARNVRRRADGVAVEVIQVIGTSPARVSRKATLALVDDGLYCLGDDGRWGARVRFGQGAPGIGDVALVTAPCLVKGGTAAGDVAAPLAPLLASLPPDGLLLQFGGGLSWFVAAPDTEAWFAALMPLVSAATTSP